MKTALIPTRVLNDSKISYLAKGVYCYLFSRSKKNTASYPVNITDQIKFDKALKELIRNFYIEFLAHSNFT
jgi:hypothetical protein